MKLEVRLVLLDEVNDPDPVPRARPVGRGSAYGSVSDAVLVAVTAADGERRSVPEPPARAELRTWRFSTETATEATGGTLVAVPDCWSRRDPALADFRGPVWYSREITADAPRARLVFGRLDYLAEIALDGTTAAAHEGGFTPVAVELPVGRPVSVRVKLDDPVEDALLERDPILNAKRKIKGVQELHDSRPGGMAMGSHFTEVHARRWGTGGITGPVHLHTSGLVRLDATFAHTVGDHLMVSWVLDNAGEACEVTIDLAIEEATARFHATLPPGASRVAVRIGTDGARRWSPDDPFSYDMRTAVHTAEGYSDGSVVTVGFRDVRMAVEGEGAFQLHLDGSRTYVRAANYIPGVWPPELTPATIRTDLELARAAGLNSVGLHAGIYPHVPALADELGVLVYQDFPLQWSYDVDAGPLSDGGSSFAEASLDLTAEMVYDLFNHPSIVYWCGHNEPAYQLGEAFGNANTPELSGLIEAINGVKDEEPLDRARLEVFRHVDPTRPSVAASGLGASRRDGDIHDYAGSLSGGHATDGLLGKTPFVTEFGAWKPNFSAAQVAVGARSDWPPPAEALRDWAERTHLPATQTAFAGAPDDFASFPEWCFAGQLWTGWHAKVLTEDARAAKYAPSAGQRWHFFVDHWGEGGAGVIDRHRVPGPAYRGLAAANRPLMPFTPIPRGGRVTPGERLVLPLLVVNDHHRDQGTMRLSWRLAQLGDGDAFLVAGREPERAGGPNEPVAAPDHVAILPRAEGRTLISGEAAVAVGADALVHAGDVAWDADVAGPMCLFLDLDGITGWTSFMVAPEGWRSTPGLTGPSRFHVTMDDPGPLVRRWTGELVDPDDAPPDQYLVDGRPVDVYDDTRVTASGVESNPLPWPDPGSRAARGPDGVSDAPEG